MSMLNKKEKAGKGEKTGRKKKVWNHSLAKELRRQSRTNYGGAERTGGCDKRTECMNYRFWKHSKLWG